VPGARPCATFDGADVGRGMFPGSGADRAGPYTVDSTATHAPTPHPGDGPASNPRLLLVVEDDRTTLSALRRILTRLGWDVHTAMTVAGGLDLLSLRPQAIILDLMLPDGDGLAVLRRVRAENLPTRVAVTTGVHDGPRLEAVRQLRPEGLIHKPVDLDQMLRAIGPPGGG